MSASDFSGASSSAPWKRVGRKFFGDLFTSNSSGLSKPKRKQLKILLESCIEYIESNVGDTELLASDKHDSEEWDRLSTISGVSALTSSMVRVSSSSLLSVLLTMLKPCLNSTSTMPGSGDELVESSKLDDSSKLSLTLLHSLLRHSLSSVSRRLIKHEWNTMLTLLIGIIECTVMKEESSDPSESQSQKTMQTDDFAVSASAEVSFEQTDARVVFECVESLCLLFDGFMLSVRSPFAREVFAQPWTQRAIECLLSVAIGGALSTVDSAHPSITVATQVRCCERSRQKASVMITRLIQSATEIGTDTFKEGIVAALARKNSGGGSGSSMKPSSLSSADAAQARMDRKLILAKTLRIGILEELKHIVIDEDVTGTVMLRKQRKSNKRQRKRRRRNLQSLAIVAQSGSKITRVCRLLSMILDLKSNQNNNSEMVSFNVNANGDELNKNEPRFEALFGLKELSRLTESLLEALDFRISSCETLSSALSKGAAPPGVNKGMLSATRQSISTDVGSVLAYSAVMITRLSKCVRTTSDSSRVGTDSMSNGDSDRFIIADVETVMKFVLSFHSLVTGSFRPLVQRYANSAARFNDGMNSERLHVSYTICLCGCLRMLATVLHSDGEDCLSKLTDIIKGVIIDTMFDCSASGTAPSDEMVIRECNSIVADLLGTLVRQSTVMQYLIESHQTSEHGAKGTLDSSTDENKNDNQEMVEDTKMDSNDDAHQSTVFMDDSIAALGFAASAEDDSDDEDSGAGGKSDEFDEMSAEVAMNDDIDGDDDDSYLSQYSNGLAASMALLNSLFHFRYRAKWILVFDLFSKVFNVFGDSVFVCEDGLSTMDETERSQRLKVLFDLVRPSFEQLCELREMSAIHLNGNQGRRTGVSEVSIVSPLVRGFLDDCIGHAIRHFGPQLTLDCFSVFPDQSENGGGDPQDLEKMLQSGKCKIGDALVSRTIAGFYQRHWMFGLLKKWLLYHCNLDYFGRYLLPMADSLFRMTSKFDAADKARVTADKGKMDEGAHVAALADLARAVWSLFPQFMKCPTDVTAAFDGESAKISEGIAKYLASMPVVCPFIIQGLSTLISNITMMRTYKESLIQSSLDTSAAGKGSSSASAAAALFRGSGDGMTVSLRSGATHTVGSGTHKMRVIDNVFFQNVLGVNDLNDMCTAISNRAPQIVPILLNLCVKKADSERVYILRLIGQFCDLCNQTSSSMSSGSDGRRISMNFPAQFVDDLMKRTMVKYLKNDSILQGKAVKLAELLKLSQTHTPSDFVGEDRENLAKLNEQSAYLMILDTLISYVSDPVMNPFWRFLQQQLSGVSTAVILGDCRLIKLLFSCLASLVLRLLLAKKEQQLTQADGLMSESIIAPLNGITEWVSSMSSLSSSKSGATAIVEKNGRLKCIAALLLNAAHVASVDMNQKKMMINQDISEDAAMMEAGDESTSPLLEIFESMISRFMPELFMNVASNLSANLRSKSLSLILEVALRLEDIDHDRFLLFVSNIVQFDRNKMENEDELIARVLCSAHLLSHLTDVRMPEKQNRMMIALLAGSDDDAYDEHSDHRKQQTSILRSKNKELFKAALSLLREVVNHCPDSLLKNGRVMPKMVSHLCRAIAAKDKRKHRTLMSRIVDKLLTRFGFETISKMVEQAAMEDRSRHQQSSRLKKARKNANGHRIAESEAMKLIKYLRKRGVYLENRKKSASERQLRNGEDGRRGKHQRGSKRQSSDPLADSDDDDEFSEGMGSDHDDFGAHSEFEKLTLRSRGEASMMSAADTAKSRKSEMRLRVDGLGGSDVLDLTESRRVNANLISLDAQTSLAMGSSLASSSKEASKKKPSLEDYGITMVETRDGREKMLISTISEQTRKQAEQKANDEDENGDADTLATSSQSPLKRRRKRSSVMSENHSDSQRRHDIWKPGELQPYEYHMVSAALMHPKKKHERKKAFEQVIGRSRRLSGLRAKSDADSLTISKRGRVDRGRVTLKRAQIRARAKHGAGVARTQTLSKRQKGLLRAQQRAAGKKRKASQI